MYSFSLEILGILINLQNVVYGVKIPDFPIFLRLQSCYNHCSGTPVSRQWRLFQDGWKRLKRSSINEFLVLPSRFSIWLLKQQQIQLKSLHVISLGQNISDHTKLINVIPLLDIIWLISDNIIQYHIKRHLLLIWEKLRKFKIPLEIKTVFRNDTVNKKRKFWHFFPSSFQCVKWNCFHYILLN